jgi:hypothetical protein
MRNPKLLIVILGLVLAASSYAADYSLNAAATAAGKLMPKDGPNDFALFNLPEPKAMPEQLLTAFRQARDQKVCLAICSPKLKYIRNLLKDTMKTAKAEKFDGLYLIIVAEKIDAAGFDELLKDRGIHVKYGVF